MKTAVLLLRALLIAGCSAASPSPTSPAPSQTVTVSPGRLGCRGGAPASPAATTAALPASTVSSLQAVLDQRTSAKPDEPSVSAAVLVPRQGFWAGAAGVEDTVSHSEASPQTIYAAASITKTFTAALTLLLVRDSLVELDKPAAGYLDSAAATKTNGASVRQLLGHRSGIDSFTDHPQIRDHAATTDELLALIGPPHADPGAQYEYSNSNYLLLGLLVEHVGGAPYEQQLRTKLLEPNGLSRTFFSARESAPAPVAHGYGSASDLKGDQYDGSGRLPNAIEASSAWAAGAIASTPTDLAHWLYALCSGAVVGDELTSEMFDDIGYGEYGLGI